jgi:hypothetical protein
MLDTLGPLKDLYGMGLTMLVWRLLLILGGRLGECNSRVLERLMLGLRLRLTGRL